MPQEFTPGVFSCGSTYGEDMGNTDIGVQGPCCKMNHTRVSKKDKQFRDMVVVGDEATVRELLFNPQRASAEEPDAETQAMQAEIDALERELAESL